MRYTQKRNRRQRNRRFSSKRRRGGRRADAISMSSMFGEKEEKEKPVSLLDTEDADVTGNLFREKKKKNASLLQTVDADHDDVLGTAGLFGEKEKTPPKAEIPIAAIPEVDDKKIEEIKEEVKEVTAKEDEIKEDVKGLKAEFDEIKNEIAVLPQKISEQNKKDRDLGIKSGLSKGMSSMSTGFSSLVDRVRKPSETPTEVAAATGETTAPVGEPPAKKKWGFWGGRRTHKRAHRPRRHTAKRSKRTRHHRRR